MGLQCSEYRLVACLCVFGCVCFFFLLLFYFYYDIKIMEVGASFTCPPKLVTALKIFARNCGFRRPRDLANVSPPYWPLPSPRWQRKTLPFALFELSLASRRSWWARVGIGIGIGIGPGPGRGWAGFSGLVSGLISGMSTPLPLPLPLPVLCHCSRNYINYKLLSS